MKKITFEKLKLLPSFVRYKYFIGIRNNLVSIPRFTSLLEGDVDLHMQFGVERGLDAVIALEAALAFLPFPVRVHLHPDSRVNHTEISRVRELVPGAVIHTSISEQEVRDHLRERRLDRLSLFREQHHLAKKLIDALVLGEQKRIIVMDDDLLIFSRCVDLSEHSNNWCLKDPAMENYSSSYADLISRGNEKLLRSVNSGFVRYERTCDDLEYLNYVLEKYNLSHDHFTEQTLWAFLLSRSDTSFLDVNRYQVGDSCIHQGTRAIHYIGHYLGRCKTEMRRNGQKLALDAAREWRLRS